MKYFVLLSLTAALIIGSYLYMKKQDELKAQAVAAASNQRLKDQERQRLSEQAALNAEAEEAALALQRQSQENQIASANSVGQGAVNVSVNGAATAANYKGGKHSGDASAHAFANDDYRKMKKEIVMEGMPLGGADGDEAKDFNYSSGYLHQKFSNKKIKSQQGSISDDLLIVEGQLEDHASRRQ